MGQPEEQEKFQEEHIFQEIQWPDAGEKKKKKEQPLS